MTRWSIFGASRDFVDLSNYGLESSRLGDVKGTTPCSISGIKQALEELNDNIAVT
jgi:hypothetical protein